MNGPLSFRERLMLANTLSRMLFSMAAMSLSLGLCLESLLEGRAGSFYVLVAAALLSFWIFHVDYRGLSRCFPED
ncbi:hypothetical protein ACSSZE_18415 [Acidithiobacillus caldus]